jgi:hypothetical protein
MYDLDGHMPPKETLDSELEGCRGSSPVRWGNAAATQQQHDVYGEILDCAYQWAAHHGSIPQALWSQLHGLAETAGKVWRKPDQGIWEVRTSGRPFTYSAALCHVALDRAARMATRFHLPGPNEQWIQSAQDIAQAILAEAWDPASSTLTEHLGGGGVDASLPCPYGGWCPLIIKRWWRRPGPSGNGWGPGRVYSIDICQRSRLTVFLDMRGRFCSAASGLSITWPNKGKLMRPWTCMIRSVPEPSRLVYCRRRLIRLPGLSWEIIPNLQPHRPRFQRRQSGENTPAPTK